MIIRKSFTYLSLKLGAPSIDQSSAIPNLWRNNLFVPNLFDIVAMIDWQNCSVIPHFLHTRPPTHFQNFAKEGSEEIVKPQVPVNFYGLDENET